MQRDDLSAVVIIPKFPPKFWESDARDRRLCLGTNPVPRRSTELSSERRKDLIMQLANIKLRRLVWVAIVMLASLSVSGCVNHYCGPAYPASGDPFCSLRTPQVLG
jgi:hypothetical protein